MDSLLFVLFSHIFKFLYFRLVNRNPCSNTSIILDLLYKVTSLEDHVKKIRSMCGVNLGPYRYYFCNSAYQLPIMLKINLKKRMQFQ